MKRRVIERAEDIRAIYLLRGQGKAKTKKSRNGRKRAFAHERILGQKVASASEILRRTPVCFCDGNSCFMPWP